LSSKEMLEIKYYGVLWWGVIICWVQCCGHLMTWYVNGVSLTCEWCVNDLWMVCHWHVNGVTGMWMVSLMCEWCVTDMWTVCHWHVNGVSLTYRFYCTWCIIVFTAVIRCKGCCLTLHWQYFLYQ
jgi:hypothetical protein